MIFIVKKNDVMGTYSNISRNSIGNLKVKMTRQGMNYKSITYDTFYTGYTIGDYTGVDFYGHFSKKTRITY